MKLNKTLFVMIHIVTPYLYFTTYTLWGHIGLQKPIWENISANLSIVGIYYMIVSLFWVPQIKNIEKVEREISRKKKEK
ncbi:hypothetical protein IC620_16670 [Hazenella sp. IB182357]|uniref:Uncharacterized protein n=1 Tax=Polycladospora coralii TaxID=2771432 RepID=A0A926NCY9_9BACL|nr:hypothetical protein [Polycladospora coralii]MBD1373977.1 hypothetical protein [Polycladospora coralii]